MRTWLNYDSIYKKFIKYWSNRYLKRLWLSPPPHPIIISPWTIEMKFLLQSIFFILKVTTGEWKWYDLQSGKWMAYTSHNNRLINDAYWRGCHSLRISSNRKRYTIAFLEMCQVSSFTCLNDYQIGGFSTSIQSAIKVVLFVHVLSGRFSISNKEN